MGVGSSKSLSDVPDDTERYYGLENFGNTCYCNAVLQALYFLKPFREHLTAATATAASETGGNEETLLSSLSELFSKIASQKKRTGVHAPRKFITNLRKENEAFRGYMQQDAHEFLNYLLNYIAETLVKEKKAREAAVNPNPHTSDPSSNSNNNASSAANKPPATWIHELFEGFLTNETKCLCCETVTNRDESFFDLSVDIEPNSSVTGCLRNFSSSETLCHKDKYFCDVCSSLQEAEKRMKIKKLPQVLALQLKRFKFTDTGYRKLSHRVVFPLELRLFNTSDDCEDRDRLYELYAIIIHIGSGPNQGHYVAIVKSGRRWVVFDDDMVEDIDERTLHTYFGANTEMASNLASGYILFYRSTSMPTSSSTSQPTRQPGGAAAARGTAVLDRDEEAEQRVNAKHDGVVAV